jgi:hypothetical protein
MASHIDGFVARLRAASAPHQDPEARFWAMTEDYLNCFVELPNVALLWFGYWVDVAHERRVEAIDQMHRAIIAVLREHLEALLVDDPGARAHALFSYLVGTVIQQAVRPVPFPELRAEIATLCHLRAGTAAP